MLQLNKGFTEGVVGIFLQPFIYVIRPMKGE